VSAFGAGGAIPPIKKSRGEGNRRIWAKPLFLTIISVHVRITSALHDQNLHQARQLWLKLQGNSVSAGERCVNTAPFVDLTLKLIERKCSDLRFFQA
jgi:hypothetical protein